MVIEYLVPAMLVDALLLVAVAVVIVMWINRH